MKDEQLKKKVSMQITAIRYECNIGNIWKFYNLQNERCFFWCVLVIKLKLDMGTELKYDE